MHRSDILISQKCTESASDFSPLDSGTYSLQFLLYEDTLEQPPMEIIYTSEVMK
jgi:hypothetical protein